MSPLLDIQSLHFKREYKTPFIDENLKINKGDTSIILGTAGSGKGLLLRICSGLMTPEEGRTNGQYTLEGKVLFDNEDIFKMDYKEMQNFRRQTGFIFEGKQGLLPHLNIMDNIALPLKYFGNTTKTLKALIRLYLQEIDFPAHDNFFKLLPYQCNHFTYSIVQILRSVIMSPKILFLENPFMLLSMSNAETLFQFILSLQKRIGFSILLGTSYINFHVSEDINFYSIDSGKIVSTDLKEAIIASSSNQLSMDGDIT